MDCYAVYQDASRGLVGLLESLLKDGRKIGSRNGATRELTNVSLRIDEPWNREILVPGRKPNIAAQIAETMWILAGRDDVEWLSRYLPRAGDFSDDGKVWRGAYGPRLRAFGRVTGSPGSGVDQLRYVVETLTADPDSRRAVMTIYDPVIDSRPGKDIPCNNWLSFLIRDGYLDLTVAIRSNDVMWGWSGINAFEWSALQEIVAGLVGARIGQLHFSTTSLHLYEYHVDKAQKILKEWDERTTRPNEVGTRFQMPENGGIETDVIGDFDVLIERWFQIEKKIRETAKQGDYNSMMVEIDRFPEPMLREWLQVILWWWTDIRLPFGSRLECATWPIYSVQPKSPWKARSLPEDEARPGPDYSDRRAKQDFIEYVQKLHDEKHAAYGDSWKRRGEMLGIMANIARKVDRLGANGGGDTAMDTAIDLLVYLAKYRWWLTDNAVYTKSVPAPMEDGIWTTPFSDTTAPANALIAHVGAHLPLGRKTAKDLEAEITRDFETLEEFVSTRNQDRFVLVDSMLEKAFLLAGGLWLKEKAK